MKIYLAYGSNMNQKQMAYRCPTAQVLGTSELPGYEMVFRGNRYDNGVATVEPLEGGSVPVLLWDIQKQDEKALDHYEGFSVLYTKKTLENPLKDNIVTAMLYVMAPGYELAPPFDSYYHTIEEGYKAAGFDTSRLKQYCNNTLNRIAQQNEYEIGIQNEMKY